MLQRTIRTATLTVTVTVTLLSRCQSFIVVGQAKTILPPHHRHIETNKVQHQEGKCQFTILILDLVNNQIDYLFINSHSRNKPSRNIHNNNSNSKRLLDPGLGGVRTISQRRVDNHLMQVLHLGVRMEWEDRCQHLYKLNHRPRKR